MAGLLVCTQHYLDFDLLLSCILATASIAAALSLAPSSLSMKRLAAKLAAVLYAFELILKFCKDYLIITF